MLFFLVEFLKGSPKICKVESEQFSIYYYYYYKCSTIETGPSVFDVLHLLENC